MTGTVSVDAQSLYDGPRKIIMGGLGLISDPWPQIARIEQSLSLFQKDIFAAVIKSFEQLDNPLRVNNFATGLRELSRILLYDLAPEKDIKACCWYEEEKNKDGAVIITRAQRIKYAVHAGLPEDQIPSSST